MIQLSIYSKDLRIIAFIIALATAIRDILFHINICINLQLVYMVYIEILLLSQNDYLISLLQHVVFCFKSLL
jgi:hypothetical protein